jgi:hypothetical protein
LVRDSASLLTAKGNGAAVVVCRSEQSQSFIEKVKYLSAAEETLGTMNCATRIETKLKSRAKGA